MEDVRRGRVIEDVERRGNAVAVEMKSGLDGLAKAGLLIAANDGRYRELLDIKRGFVGSSRR